MNQERFRHVAVSKTGTGTMIYAIIDSVTMDVCAIAYCNGGCFKLSFTDVTPTSQEQVLKYVRKELNK